MNHLTIQNLCTDGVTAVSNRFLDEYMPQANGEFVKIYLYLLRQMTSGDSTLTLTSIADIFNCTQRDVERALWYWDKHQIISLSTDQENQIVGLTLLPLPAVQTEPSPSRQGDSAAKPNVSSTPKRPISSPSEYVITPDKAKELKQKEDVMQLLFIAEQYLGKTLSLTETSRILYFYEHLQFSADLIEYLIEYCVSKGSKSIRYMEKVALSWAEAGITTVELAKKETNTFQKQYFSVLKAFGITNRSPVESEIQMINRWRNDYGFTSDLITEACSRTITQTGKSSFQYADGILSAWHKHNVHTLADVQKLDAHHRDRRETRTVKTPAKTTNKFNNFHQRDYNFSDLERQLLKK